MAQQRRFSGSALAAVTLLGAAGTLAALPATPAQAQAAQTSGAELRVLSPRQNEAMGSGTFSLDVSFKSRTKSPVISAELWVDGVRWVQRDLDAPQTKNVLSFAVDASTLSEGVHAVVIKVFTANGAASSTQINVRAGNNAGTGEGAISGPQMRFVAPVNGKRVAGTVEIAMDAPSKGGLNPYVTFYVDKQFKTLKNYPPYSYQWDTTGVANGYHTVEAMGYLDSSNATTTRRVTVLVDNAGGATDIKSDIPDLSEARKQAPVTSPARAVAAPVVLPVRKKVAPKPAPLAPVAPVSPVGEAAFAAPAAADSVSSLGLAPVTAAFRADASSLHATLPGSVQPANVVKAVKSAPVLRIPVKTVAPVKTKEATPAPAFSPLPNLSAPVYAVPALKLPTAFRPLAPRTIAAPRFAAPPARVAPLAPAAAPVRPMTQTAPRATVAPAAVHRGIARLETPAAKNRKLLQVAFDGQQIAFDVQPRVEAGLPLAPFRQIFEHTGGQVMWVPETRVVRAVNADREIVINVGTSRANVNGQSVSLQKPAFIEKGRTIVPLSFVGKALDVDVKYDPATGHLQITSK